VTVTAFEARNPRKDLRFPSKYIAWIIFFLFLICGLGEVLNVEWNNSKLPDLNPRSTTPVGNLTGPHVHKSPSILIISAQSTNVKGLAGFLNACLIFTCLSAATTSLYVSSRTLYGLTRELREDRPWPLSWFAKFGTIHPKTSVPVWALFVSALAFIWLPFIHLLRGYSIQDASSTLSRILPCWTDTLTFSCSK
jgi:amino acid transporter